MFTKRISLPSSKRAADYRIYLFSFLCCHLLITTAACGKTNPDPTASPAPTIQVGDDRTFTDRWWFGTYLPAAYTTGSEQN